MFIYYPFLNLLFKVCIFKIFNELILLAVGKFLRFTATRKHLATVSQFIQDYPIYVRLDVVLD